MSSGRAGAQMVPTLTGCSVVAILKFLVILSLNVCFMSEVREDHRGYAWGWGICSHAGPLKLPVPLPRAQQWQFPPSWPHSSTSSREPGGSESVPTLAQEPKMSQCKASVPSGVAFSLYWLRAWNTDAWLHSLAPGRPHHVWHHMSVLGYLEGSPAAGGHHTHSRLQGKNPGACGSLHTHPQVSHCPEGTARNSK